MRELKGFMDPPSSGGVPGAEEVPGTEEGQLQLWLTGPDLGVGQAYFILRDPYIRISSLGTLGTLELKLLSP